MKDVFYFQQYATLVASTKVHAWNRILVDAMTVMQASDAKTVRIFC